MDGSERHKSREESLGCLVSFSAKAKLQQRTTLKGLLSGSFPSHFYPPQTEINADQGPTQARKKAGGASAIGEIDPWLTRDSKRGHA